ncbi:ABC transporter substrate-binding protein [Sphingomonas corticis]|jgi:peptide/nickel transport system substrate-binding protein|uniref:ABC transporter substrate-binding protein n=1 Tax=Sphingomonas corticis TaxID=2722791 RepID=A0ABX1CRJ4_9SPHN|nr:ABC transporter substrate-binding protein [Sphingomonas corticis]NJR80580.1 ABC transporter substrate-binding protein [Sphingomonas corticis]
MTSRLRRRSSLPLLLLALSSAAACGRRADVGPVVVSVVGEGKPALARADRRDLPPGDRALTGALAMGLVRLDAAGQVEAGLAQRWIVTDGGMSFIFRLGRTRWSDGAPVTAAEVVALLRRQIAAGARNDLSPYLSAISRVVEMTPEVIEVELSRPRPDLLKLFAQPEMALVRARRAAGAGPFRLAREEPDALLLTPLPDPDREADDRARPEDDVRLRVEPAARAVARFVDRGSDLVAGGTIADWPLVRAAQPAAANVRIDPAAGLFGLVVARRDAFLADIANRAAVAQAIDRAALAAAVSPDWPARDTLLPDQLDSATPPVSPAWSALPVTERRAAAAGIVARWRAGRGAAPVLRLALPGGAGGTILFAHLARDLLAIGVRPVRVAADDDAADLVLVDRVAPYDSARWYLDQACRDCAPAAREAIEAARVAPTLADRARSIAAADAALTEDGGFIPLARPFRWSLVAYRLRAWTANPRAWHPLNRLRADTN